MNVGVTAWCLVYVSVTFTVMRDGTSLNSVTAGGTTQKQCHTSHVTYPDPATTRIRPGSNDRVPGSGTQRNSLPVPPLQESQGKTNVKAATLTFTELLYHTQQ